MSGREEGHQRLPDQRRVLAPSRACTSPPLAEILALWPSDSEKTSGRRHLDLAAANLRRKKMRKREGRWSRRQREKQVGEAMEQRRWLGCAAAAG